MFRVSQHPSSGVLKTVPEKYTKKVVAQLSKAISSAMYEQISSAMYEQVSSAMYEQAITYFGQLEGSKILKHAFVFIYA